MKNSLKWTAAFLAACMLLSAGVMAEDVADETTEPTAEAETTEAAAETTDEAEWVFANKSNGTGVVASNNATYLMTASANSNYLRSYKKETQTKAGIFFFKKE